MTATVTTAPARSVETVRRERRITLALFAAGLTTFGSMYSAQALLPSLSAAFGASPAQAALAVSLTTGLLAVAIVPVSVLSGRFGRTRVMIVSAVTTSVLGLLLPFSPNLDLLLAGRAIEGIAVAGVPAVAMAYLAEEIGSAGLGAAMGVYVAGTTVGGLTGRLIPAFVLEVADWRWGAALFAVAAGLCTVWFVRLLPPSRRFVPQPLGIGALAGDLAGHVRNRSLLPLFGLAFLLMGGFVSVYNFLGYRLTQSPFGLSAATAGSVFLMYLSGTVSSTAAGRLADRLGRFPVVALSILTMGIGLVLTIPDQLTIMLPGLLLFTAGFFGAHAVASAWVGATATGNRAAASSLYLFAYYVGSSIVGALAGVAYSWHGWAGLALYVGVLIVVATGLVLTLPHTARSHEARGVRLSAAR